MIESRAQGSTDGNGHDERAGAVADRRTPAALARVPAKSSSGTATFQAAGATAPPSSGSEPPFEHGRLDVYRVALEFQELVPRLVPPRGYAPLRDQLDCASSFVLLNIAEACGRSARPDKAQFYRIARGSAMESAAVLGVLLIRGPIAPATHRHARGLLLRVAQMLTKRVQRMVR